MKTSLHKQLDNPFHRYLVVGGSVYLFELFVVWLVLRVGGSGLLAVSCSFWLGLVVSFGLQKFVAFQDRRLQRKVVGAQLAAVTLLVLFNFGFTLLAVNALARWLPVAVSRTIALGITSFWNFYLYKTRIFHQQTNEPFVD